MRHMNLSPICISQIKQWIFRTPVNHSNKLHFFYADLYTTVASFKHMADAFIQTNSAYKVISMCSLGIESVTFVLYQWSYRNNFINLI